jgi:hypothetical protein
MLRLFTILLVVFSLSACMKNDLSEPPPDLGNFKLAHNVVVAPDLVMGPLSREADKDQFIASVQKAVDNRFSRHDGDKFYHFGVNLSGYVLAQPGIPVVLAPKSILIFTLTVWDDENSAKLNAKPEQITVLETLSGDTIVGSGLTKSPEQQMEALAFNAAKAIETYLIENRAWFDGSAVE